MKLRQTRNGLQYSVIKIPELIITNTKKRGILENATGNIDLILEALKKWFSGLSEENSSNEDVSGTPIAGDTILCNMCQVLHSLKSIVPDGATFLMLLKL